MLGNIKQWQWLLLSVLVGFTLPLVRTSLDGELYGLEVRGHGYRLARQDRFEDALVTEYEGRRQFKDITVYPVFATEKSGDKKLVQLVCGSFYSGHPEERDGQLVGRWYPSCFVAPVPYRPNGFPAGTNPEAIQRFQALQLPTVLDYLRVLEGGRAVTYRYAWWMAWPRLTWMAASVLVIGIVWPTCLNLMLYGTWRRPAEEKGIDLSQVRSSRPAQQVPARPVIAGGRDLDTELDALLQNRTNMGAEKACAELAPVPILNAAPIEPATTIPEVSAAEFGQKPDDFYPTERRHSQRASV